MDSTILQLEKGDREFPVFLLQYSYYINRVASKQIVIGFDVHTFKPYITLISLDEKKFLFFTPDTWRFISICLPDCESYLAGKTENYFVITPDQVLKIEKTISTDDQRAILFTNLNSNCDISINLEEVTTLCQLIPFLSRMNTHFDEKWGFVKEFYRSYLLKCYVGDTNHLLLKQFFKIDAPSVNYYRLFNEIPILCRDKIISDLEELYAGQV